MIVQGIPTQNSLRFWVSINESENLDGFLETLDGFPDIPLNKEELKLRNGEIVANLFSAEGLKENKKYLFVLRDSEGIMKNGRICNTLPESLKDNELPISLGSCYWLFHKSAFSQSSLPYQKFSKPLFRFLVGDQIYNDRFSTGFFGVVNDSAFNTPNPFENYKEQWGNKSFQSFFTAIPNAVLADDHDFWDDYPNEKSFQFWSTFKSENDTTELIKNCESAFNTYQLPLNPNKLKSFRLDFKELSFFALDTRLSRKSGIKFMDYDDDRRLFSEWINNLKTPGVLVISDLIVCEPDPRRKFDDVSLANFTEDYFYIWNELIKSNHDILVLAGDAHYNRFGYVEINPRKDFNFRKGRIYECICSPLSVLDTAEDQFPEDYKKKVFNIIDSNQNNTKLTYNNLFPRDEEFDKNTNSTATITFKPYNGGVKFEVIYFNTITGDILNKSGFSINSQNNILY